MLALFFLPPPRPQCLPVFPGAGLGDVISCNSSHYTSLTAEPVIRRLEFSSWAVVTCICLESTTAGGAGAEVSFCSNSVPAFRSLQRSDHHTPLPGSCPRPGVLCSNPTVARGHAEAWPESWERQSCLRTGPAGPCRTRSRALLSSGAALPPWMKRREAGPCRWPTKEQAASGAHSSQERKGRSEAAGELEEGSGTSGTGRPPSREAEGHLHVKWATAGRLREDRYGS